MKKFYFILSVMLGFTLSFAQTPIITAVADGDCSGGNPKLVEIYANGTVDFSMYSLEKQSNGGDWGTTTNLTELGTVTDAFVYVYSDSTDPEIFSTEFPSATTAIENSVVNINGDDGIRIVMDADMSVVDSFGEDAVDGTGTAWEYKDGYAKRMNGTTPNGTFVISDWTFNNGGLDGAGSCQDADNFETVMGGIGTFTMTASTEPMLTITSPVNNATLPLGTTSVTVEFTTNNFQIGATNAGLDGHLHYTVDGGNMTMYYSQDPFTVDNLTPGEHTINAWLVDNNHQPLDPEVNASVTFTIPSQSNVANIAELRAGTEGSQYTLTGEAILTMQQDYRGQKWIEDATGAILIDDNNGVITTTYNRYDGITGITGTLSAYNGVMQFLPAADPGAASSTGNTLEPQEISVADFNANPDMYESELVMFNAVTYSGEPTTWENGTNYTFTASDVPEDALAVRTNFYNVDYIGTDIPAEAVVLIGIAGEYNGAAQMYPRDNNDIQGAFSVNDSFLDTNAVKVAVANNQLNVNGFDAKEVKIYNVNGVQVANNAFVGNLNAGVYIAVMRNEKGQTVNVKFIKK